MAKKVKKVTRPSVKTLMSTEVAYWKGHSKEVESQNEALGEQLAGLQEEVMDIVEENEELNDAFDEQDEINNALQKSITAHVATIDYLDQRVEEQENLLQLADIVVDESDEYEALTEAEIAELKQDNHHLTIQLAAAKDKLAKYQRVYTDGILRYDLPTSPHQFNADTTYTNSALSRTATDQVEGSYGRYASSGNNRTATGRKF